MRRAILAIAVLAAACGDDGGGPAGDATPGGPDAADIDAAGGVNVADPGDGPLVFDWLDTEGNDDEAHAVPLGTADGDVYTWMGFVADPPSTIGNGDLEDWYVFRSGPTGGAFHSQICWDAAAGNAADIYLWEYIPPAAPAVIAMSTTDTQCDTIDVAALMPSTIYLYEVRGLGPASMYSS